MRIFFILAVLATSYFIKAQPLDYLPDSVKLELKVKPETVYDSIYMEAGSNYYTQFNAQGYSRALDCFKIASIYAEKHKHDDWIIESIHSIGSVYDAQGDAPDKMLYYYKQAFEVSKRTKDAEWYKTNLAYNVAHAYNLMHDSANSMLYLNKLKECLYLFNDKPQKYNQSILLMTYLTMKNNNIRDFLPLFESLNKTDVYKDGTFPYGRYFALCTWRYAFEKGQFVKAIEAIQFELKNNTTDSSLLMSYLSEAYAKSGNYQKAYEWSAKLNTFDSEHLKKSFKKDLVVNLLKTDNELAEKEKALKERENGYLLRGLAITLLLAGVALYFWFANYKSKKEKETLNNQLAQRNAEKTVLINEIHHRVKNNLQLLYSLAKLQLPTIEDENAKLLWQKHLSQLKAMSLVNERLYNMEGVGDVYLRIFVQDILAHFGQIFPIEHPLSIEQKLDENVVVSADFAVSFGLLFSELVVNSYKYAFPNNEKPKMNLTISIKKEGVLHFEYTDFGKVETPSVFQTKQIGGVTLIQDLTRQLKGNMVIKHEPHLFYTFSFPIT